MDLIKLVDEIIEEMVLIERLNILGDPTVHRQETLKKRLLSLVDTADLQGQVKGLSSALSRTRDVKEKVFPDPELMEKAYGIQGGYREMVKEMRDGGEVKINLSLHPEGEDNSFRCGFEMARGDAAGICHALNEKSTTDNERAALKEAADEIHGMAPIKQWVVDKGDYLETVDEEPGRCFGETDVKNISYNGEAPPGRVWIHGWGVYLSLSKLKEKESAKSGSDAAD